LPASVNVVSSTSTKVLTVEAQLEVVARELDAKRVPLARRDWFLHAVTALASTLSSGLRFPSQSCKGHVALERIRPRDVVVVGILRTQITPPA